MIRFALLSLALHIGIILLILSGGHFFFKRPPAETSPLLIEFDIISNVSSAPAIGPDAHKQEDKKLGQKKPEATIDDLGMSDDDEVAILEEPKPEEIEPLKPLEEPKKEEPIQEIEPPKEEAPAPPKPIEKKKEIKKKSEPKKEKKKDKKKPTKAEVNLAKKKKKNPDKEKSLDDILQDTLDDMLSEGDQSTAPVSQVSDVISASQIDAIRQKIYPCWNVPVGARGAKDLVVDMNVRIDRDGFVTHAEIADKSRLSDAFFQSAAESARRALFDPHCNPLPLPKEKYDEWKEITLTFNPKDMF
jgi:outer membrane biosynthesis protein TonB